MFTSTNQIINEVRSYGLDLSKLMAEMLVAESQGKLALCMHDLCNTELIVGRCILRFNLAVHS